MYASSLINIKRDTSNRTLCYLYGETPKSASMNRQVNVPQSFSRIIEASGRKDSRKLVLSLRESLTGQYSQSNQSRIIPLQRLAELQNKISSFANRAVAVSPNVLPDVKYSLRLMQLGMEPLVVRRLKSALLMAYKFIFGRIPFANSFFETFVPVASSCLVAGNTWNAHQRLHHPRPIQVINKYDSAFLAHGCSNFVSLRTRGPAKGSFSDIIQEIWNDLPFAESAYASLGAFEAALEDLDWKRLPFVAKVLSESCCSSWMNCTDI